MTRWIWTFLWIPLSAFGAPLEVDIQDEGFSLDAETQVEIRQVLGRMAAMYDRSFGLSYPESMQVKLRIFADQEAFFTYQKKISNQVHSPWGVYSTRTNEAMLWKNTSDALMLETLFHESSHFLLENGGGLAPVWVHEGLAEVFESARKEGNSILIRPQPQLDAHLHKLLSTGEAPDLKLFLSASGTDWRRFDAQSKGMGYAMARSLCFYLLSRADGRKLIRKILTSYTDPYRQAGSAHIVDQAVPGGITALERRWKAWLISNQQSLYVPLAVDAGWPEGASQDWKMQEDGTIIHKAADTASGWQLQPDGTLKPSK